MRNSNNRPITMRQMANFRYKNQGYANFATDNKPNFLGGVRDRFDDGRKAVGRYAQNVGQGIQRDIKDIGGNYRANVFDQMIDTNKKINAGIGGNLQVNQLRRGGRLGAGLNSGRKFLLGTNTGRVGLGVGALGLGYAGYRGLRGKD